MRNLILTAVASAALGCAAGYALAPDGGSDANTAVLADGGPGLGQAEAGRGSGRAGGMGHSGGPGMGGRGGHGGGPNAGGGPRGRGQPGAGGPGRARRPPTGFDLAELERSLAHMSVELTLEDAQQQAIRDVMRDYRIRIRELREAILAELTPEQREKLSAVEAAASPDGSAEQTADTKD